MNYYEILGVESTATTEEIKEAYRNKAKELHPDKLIGINETVRKLAEEQLKELNHAYEILKSRTGTSGVRERREGETPAIKITTERALQMLRGGEAGIKAWNQFRKVESYIPSLEGVDLSGQQLYNANLSKANLKNSKFIKAVLSGANLSHANLVESDFTESKLYNTNFNNSDLKNSKIVKSSLSSVILNNANLAQCDFTESKLYNTNFNNSDLKNSKFIKAHFTTDVNFNDADLKSANLTSVVCYGSTFVNANLQNAILNQSRGFILTFYESDERGEYDKKFKTEGSYIKTNTSEDGRNSTFIDKYIKYQKTDFKGANLSGASVIGANLQECNLEGANLTNTNFSNANLYRANLKNTTIVNTDFKGTDLRKADLTGANAYCFGVYDVNTQISGTKGID
jgi:uncharacterized protein YjbI with pentapeptide repeats